MNVVETLEKAAEAIKELQAETEEAIEKLATYKRAHVLGFSLMKEGAILVEDLDSKIDEFAEKTAAEIEVLEKAAELVTDSNGSFSFGKLGEEFNEESLSPEEAFVLGLAR